MKNDLSYHNLVWKMPLSWHWTGHSGGYWQQAEQCTEVMQAEHWWRSTYTIYTIMPGRRLSCMVPAKNYKLLTIYNSWCQQCVQTFVSQWTVVISNVTVTIDQLDAGGLGRRCHAARNQGVNQFLCSVSAQSSSHFSILHLRIKAKVNCLSIMTPSDT